ncbi:phosphatidylinositol-specific phospholipase C/glycerophosphodiester phosphodiesterase family protein [Tuwongella immobilis]|uniref:Altered inheritance of mitochondria protein 6 n=1 Tax=Tuwongella immobilis TaxID=692036 RepID=A0A6C2YMH3_9BACT|nr:phosphatidylinositol-specific phospholipase C/glycerophosphodiester phosphodiesterase family protein [Tuwongella immobilis]VIP02275.1 secreted protein : Glycerophosphoryl diester phosphodiesterase OS=Amycolatopsis methanolica 239 GN=AMETH_2314 PE=4 SV=1 [Tuwongella immobilis]VTS00911.1 secreted protein : Glycerophosphoryl diester phosphodiesterase OS=Amycolatopsis methanolica 239 GN=AMETH_2314 PE=4 SV=1 [Tuwongella immobilis]
MQHAWIGWSLWGAALGMIAQAQPVDPIPQAHSHNDYEQPRALLDALDQGFTSVEADIWLLPDGQLGVAHTPFGLRNSRTLESLYLKPLSERVAQNRGRVMPGVPSFTLLIDIKTKGPETFAALQKQLVAYESMLSGVRDGKFQSRAVTVIISGNCPRTEILQSQPRLAAIDGRLGDLDSDAPAHEIPMISAAWSSRFRWKGTGEMPESERKALAEIVQKAHAKGRVVRFWAAPDLPASWALQQAAGVDRINTDRLADLRQFLTTKPAK